MAENNQSHLNGHALASVADRFEQMRQEALADEKANKGSVWTISFDGTSNITAYGLAKCDYTLHVSASHVGETMFGVYRGEMSMEFKGDMSGAKAVLAVLGMGTSEDLSGWFRNDNFVMKLSPYDATEESEFEAVFTPVSTVKAPELTGDPKTDAARKAGYDWAMNFVNSLTAGVTSAQQTAIKAETSTKKALGLWSDYDFRMTEGDMSVYLKLGGGNGIYAAAGSASTDAEGKHTTGGATATTILSPTYSSKIDEYEDSPFPYTIKTFPDGTALFTLYNAKDPNVKVYWNGTIDAIDVDQTIVVK